MTVARSIPNARLDGWAVLDGSFEIDYEESGEYHPAPAAGFAPMRDKPLKFRTLEGLRAINFKCYPYLLAQPAFAILQTSGRSLGFEQIFPKTAVKTLLDALQGGRLSESQKIEHVETFLSQWLTEVYPPDAWLQAMMSNIGDDMATVEQLAAASFMSVKTLERRFQQYTRLNPKSFCKLARFQRALKSIQQSVPGQGTIQSVWDAGYYDQSHFIKDCRAITGLPPGRLFTCLPRLLTDIILVSDPMAF